MTGNEWENVVVVVVVIIIIVGIIAKRKREYFKDLDWLYLPAIMGLSKYTHKNSK